MKDYMFQFLIGSLTTVIVLTATPEEFEFQFLIGSLTTFASLSILTNSTLVSIPYR